MAAFDTTRPTYNTSSKGLDTFFASTIAAFTLWNDNRVTRKALNRLSERELNDIGLTRADIHSL